MLKRLRVKFICVFMAVVTVLLLVAFGMVLSFTRADLEAQSLQALRDIAAGSEIPEMPGRPGGHMRPSERPALMAYFVLEELPTGELLATGSDRFDLSEGDYLRSLLEKAADTGRESGLLYQHGLRFYRDVSPRGERYIFVDITAQWQTLRNLVGACLLIGAIVLVAFFFVSVLLARWLVKPVEESWNRQRQFVADASHELKTPLTVIMTNTELLRSAPEGEPRERALAGIHTMSRQMRGLVESLLELARVDNGAAAVHMGTVEFDRLVSDAVLPFEALFFEQGLELSVRTEESIRVKGSESHLKQVVDILLDNGQKYSAGGTEVRVELKRQSRGQCLLSVSNRGEEISKEDLKNIFKRFYRVDKARAMNHSYGLGLSIAESIVRDHKGRIWAESEGGVNTFFVQLPCE